MCVAHTKTPRDKFRDESKVEAGHGNKRRTKMMIL